MLLPGWPGPAQVPTLDLRALRESIAGNDAARFLAAVTGCDVDDALHHVGPACRWRCDSAGIRLSRWRCR
jgi:hypothetical protein